MKKKVGIGVRLDPSIIKRIEKVAEQERRTFSDMLRLLLEEALEDQKYQKSA